MDKAKQIRKGEEQNWPSLEKYLSSVLDTSGRMGVTQFHGGHANLTYLITFGEKEYVLRRPPFGKIAPGAHDMNREYTVLSKLYKHYTPAPQAYHYCDDESILGAPFVILERKQGIVARSKMPDEFSDFKNIEKRLSTSLMNALADLHQVDYKKADLSRLGKPDGYVERQLDGWRMRWSLSKLEKNKEMEEVLRRLSKKIPITQRSTIVHNDFKLDNCQFQPNDPDKITGVFDWDMCTLGDPLTDLGTTLSYWKEPEYDIYQLPIMLQGDLPDKNFLKNIYAEKTGIDLSEIKWYEALAFAKGVVIAQQLYARYVQGASTDDRMKMFGKTAKVLSKIALDTLEKN